MDKNDVVEIEITGMTDDGSGVGRAEGIAVFVPYTIVGEVIKAHIIKVNKNYAVGKLLDIIKPSEHRTKALCPHFYKCGGCQLMHMDYDAELLYKKNKVADCMKRIGGIETEVSDIVASDDRFRYRNKVQLPVTEEGIGFYKAHSHNVIDMDDCLLQSEAVKEIAFTVRKWMKECNIEAYNEENGTGLIRHIYLREGKSGTVLVIVTFEEKLPHTDKLIEMLKGTNVTGIVQNINPKKTNVVLGREYKTIWGSDLIRDNIGDKEFEISPASFYQVNKTQTEKLYSVAEKMADLTGKETVYDIYCGIGTIGQFMADKVKKLVGIEIVPDAVSNAVKNARINGIENTSYYCGAAEKIADEIIKKEGKPNVIILDPPRKGCEESLLDAVVKAKPEKIVYISCKASTLARDLKYLEGKKYKVQKIVPVDMFPNTTHVETVVLLQRDINTI